MASLEEAQKQRWPTTFLVKDWIWPKWSGGVGIGSEMVAWWWWISPSGVAIAWAHPSWRTGDGGKGDGDGGGGLRSRCDKRGERTKEKGMRKRITKRQIYPPFLMEIYWAIEVGNDVK